MPLMDGLTFLKILMEHHPVPVIVVSNLTPAGSALALDALAAGAVDVLQKPDGEAGRAELSRRLCAQVHAAAASRRRLRSASTVAPVATAMAPIARGRILVIGASTGGVEALRFDARRVSPRRSRP